MSAADAGREDAGMHPMEEGQAGRPQITLKVRDCDQEADALRKYCEGKFPVGQPTARRLSVTGEAYTELAHEWSGAYPTPQAAGEAAKAAFDKYAEGKEGALYWRAPPEIDERQHKFAYYMRLLISSKTPIVKES